MTVAYPELVAVDHVMDAAASIATVDALGCAHLSLPVAMPGPEGLRIAFVHAATRRRPGDHVHEVSEPRFVSSFDGETGDLLELKPIDAAAYALTTLAGWTPARYDGPIPERVADVHAFTQAFDRLAVPFARGALALPGVDRARPAELLTLYRTLNELAVADACRALAPTWFSWLEHGPG